MASNSTVKLSHRVEQRVTLEFDVPAYVAHRIGNALVQSGQPSLGHEILAYLGVGNQGEPLKQADRVTYYPALDKTSDES